MDVIPSEVIDDTDILIKDSSRDVVHQFDHWVQLFRFLPSLAQQIQPIRMVH
jgi:hypothetical protein